MIEDDDELTQSDEIRTEEDAGAVVESGADLEDDEPVAPPEPKAKEPEEPAQPAKETAAERRDRRVMEAELRAAREEVEYWRKQGAAVSKPAPQPSEKLDAEEFSVDKKLEMLVRDPDAYLKRAGYVRADEVERISETRARELLERESGARREEAKLLAEFKELGDEKSDLFQRTTRHLEEATGGDKAKLGDPAMIRLAARAAKAELEAEAAASKQKQQRIASQPPTGRRVSSEGPVMSDLTRKFAEKMGLKASSMKNVERYSREMSRKGDL